MAIVPVALQVKDMIPCQPAAGNVCRPTPEITSTAPLEDTNVCVPELCRTACKLTTLNGAPPKSNTYGVEQQPLWFQILPGGESK